MNKIYNFTLKFLPFLCFLFSSFSAFSQTPSASFATWKDNKKAAYTIIHDDYSDYVTGIFQHAYPIATARGIKICFGAITGFCGATEWANARTMIAAGHECVNHSHNHKCGGSAGQCTGLTTYSAADFNTELTQSTNLIQSNTGVKPLFFIHPYDASSDAILNHLKVNLGYLGTRAGTQGVVNASNFTDFLHENYFVYDGTPAALTSLNTAVNTAISSGGYAVREFHGIDDGSWSAMTVANYTSHLDYVKSKIDDGSLWSATSSEAITYKMQRDAWSMVSSYSAATNSVAVNFNSLSAIDASILKTPVTINVNLNGITGDFDVFQNNNTTIIPSKRVGDIISFNVYPHQGNVALKCTNCTVTPPVQPLDVTNLAGTPQTNAVAVSWTNPSSFDEIRIIAKVASITDVPTNYTTTNDFTAGRIVYSSTGSTTTVTGLTPNTRYYFKAFTRLGNLWSNGVEVNAIPTALAAVTAVPGCLKASYFNNVNLTGTATVVRAESKIDNAWVTSAPVAGIPADNFSVRWEGVVNPPLSGNYTFTMAADDGARLWVNNQLVIDKWIDQSLSTYTVVVNLTQGQSIPIKMEYYERGGNADAHLSWTIPTQTKQIIAFEACPITTPPVVVAAFDAAKCYRISARHSGKALEITTNSTLNGIVIQQNAWKGTREQIWRIKSFDGTHYQVSNGYSGRLMTVANSSTADAATVYQYANQNTNNQKWQFDKNTEGYYFLSPKHAATKVLDINGGSTANGANAIQYAKTGGTNQQFTVAEAGCPAGVQALESSQIVVFEGKLDNRKAVLQWVVNSEDLKDYYEIEKADDTHDFQQLTVVNGNSSDVLRTFSYTDENLADGDNYYRLKSIAADGSVKTSEVVKLRYAQPENYTLSPNPASDALDIDLSDIQGKAVELTLISALGKVIRSEKIESVDKMHHKMSLDNVENGQYFVKIQVADKRMVIKKLVVIK